MTKIRTNPNVRNFYADWLSSFQWNYYATLTTKYRLTMPSARRAMEGMYKEIAKGGAAAIFFAVEPFDLKEGYHVHALIQAPKGYQYKHVLQVWQHVSGNKRKSKNEGEASTWNRVDLQTYKPKLGARHYVGKYIMKEGCDYDILINPGLHEVTP